MPLELGPYEEELRLFLLDAPFPVDVVLVTALGFATDPPVRHRGFAFLPFTKQRDQSYQHHRFAVLGISFEMFTGPGIPPDWRALCIVRSPGRLVVRSSRVDYWNDEDTKDGTVKAFAGRKKRRRR